MAFPKLGVEATVDGYSDFMSKLGKMDSKVQDVGDSATKGLNPIQRLGAGIKDLGVLAAKAAATGLVVVSTALVAIGASSIKTAKEFQSAMAVLGVAAKSSGTSLQELHDAALRVGEDTSLVGVSASGAAEALTGLYKAGLTSTEIFGDLQGYLAGTAELGGALRASIDLAAASNMDIATASDIAAVALATFGGELKTESERAEFINKALNNLVQAADASVAEVEDLAAAMGNVGPTAAAFGFTLEDVNTALAILSTRGISGAEAGTALKSMLTNIMRPTDAVKEALKDLNIQLYDADGNMRSLPDIVGQFSNALYGAQEVTAFVGGRTAEQNHQLDLAKRAYNQASDAIYKHNAGLKTLSDKTLAKYQDQLASANVEIGRLSGITGAAVKTTRTLTEEQRNQYIQTLAGTYGMKAMQTLLSEGIVGWEEMTAAIGDASTIQEIAAARANTFEGRMEALAGVIETLKIRIGEALLPLLTDFVDWAAEFIGTHGPKLTAIFETIASVIRATVEIIGDLARYFSFVVSEGDYLNDWLTHLPPAFQPVIQRIGELVSWLRDHIPLAIQTASEFWQTMLLPALTTVAAFVQEQVIPAIGNLVSWLQTNIPLAVEAASTIWQERLRPALEEVWNFITESVIPAFTTVVEWLQTHIPLAIETVATFWAETLRPALEEVWAFINESVVPALASIFDWLQVQIPLAVQTLVAFWTETLRPALEEVWGFIQENLEPILVGLAAVVGTVLVAAFIAWAASAVSAAAATAAALAPIVVPLAAIGAAAALLYKAWTENWGGIQEKTAAVLGWLEENVLPIIKKVAEWIKDRLEDAVEWVRRNWPAIRDTIGDVLEWVWDKVQDVLDAIRLFWDRHGEKIIEIVKNIWEIIKTAVSTALQVVQGIISAITSAIQGDWAGAWAAIKGVASTIWEGIKSIVSTAIETVKNVIGLTLTIAQGIWESLWRNIKTFAEDRWEDIKTAVSTAIEWVRDKINDILGFILNTTWKEKWDAIKTKASDIWEDIKGVVDTLINEVWNIISNIMTDILNTMIGIWNDIYTAVSDKWEDIKKLVGDKLEETKQKILDLAQSFIDAGKRIVEKVKEGIANAWEDLKRWFSDRLADLTSLLPWSEPRDVTSPLYGLSRVGKAIINNIIDGLEAQADKLLQAVRGIADAVVDEFEEGIEDLFAVPNQLLEAAGVFGGLGSAAARLLGEQIEADPRLGRIEAEMDKANKELAYVQEQLDIAREQAMRYEGLLETTTDRMQRLYYIKMLRGIYESIDIYERAIAAKEDERLKIAERMAEVKAEQAEQERRILELQKAQENLKFLKEQLDFIRFIREEGLNMADILQGATLGLEADLPALVEAMTRAMNVMVEKAEEELGIGSPSRVFEQIGQRVMGGLALGIKEMMNLPAMGVDLAVRRMITAPAIAAPSIVVQPVVTSGPQVDIHAGRNNITSGMDEAAFDTRVKLAVERALAGHRR